MNPSFKPSVSRNVHSTAIIDPSAKVPASCKIGPYCIVGTDVELGQNCRLESHVVIDGQSVGYLGKVNSRQYYVSESVPSEVPACITESQDTDGRTRYGVKLELRFKAIKEGKEDL